jgi:hypothetical protein
LAGETEVLGENLPQATLSNTNPTGLDPSLNPGRRCGKPPTNRLSYGTTLVLIFFYGSTALVGLGRVISPSEGRYLHTE